MDARTFGNYLSRMRKAQGMTQAELAEQLHVTDKAVSRWERGIGLPDINTLEPLADALGLTLADLMHCRAPEEADAAPTVQLEDFFTMLRRQHAVDWHSVRTALLGLSIALALWGVLACPGTIAVHWYGLGDGSFRADGWMHSLVIFPLCAGIEFLSLEIWNSFEQTGYYRRWGEINLFIIHAMSFGTRSARWMKIVLDLLFFFCGSICGSMDDFFELIPFSSCEKGTAEYPQALRCPEFKTIIQPSSSSTPALGRAPTA